MDITYKKLSEIMPYSKNAKKHDAKQVANVAESIRKYGFVQPVVVDREGVIVIGHCRALAAQQLGMEAVPCICVDHLTPEQVAALRIVDNKSNESEWDLTLLAEELPTLDLTGFEFDFELPEFAEPLPLEDCAEETDIADGTIAAHCPKCGFYFEVQK